MNPVRTLFVCFLSLLATALPAGAQTWTPVGPAGGGVFRVFVAPSQPATLFAFGGDDVGGLFKTTNSGDTWQSISAGLSAGSCDIHVNDVAVHPTDPNTIYVATMSLGVCKSTDGGTTWTQSISGLPNDANQYQRRMYAIAVNPQTPTVLFAGTDVGLYRSLNGGGTWSFSGIPNQPVESIAFAPSAANTAYASAEDGLFKTTDGGATWLSAATGLPSDVAPGLITVSPTSPNTAFLVSNNVYKTTDGGSSWATSNTGIGAAEFLGNISIDPTNPSIMFLTAPGGCGVCKSTDGGATWAAAGASGLPTAFGFANLAITMTIDPLTPSRMFAGTPNGAYRSLNSGVNWTAITTGFNGLSVDALALGPDTPASTYIAVSSSDDSTGIFRAIGGALPFTSVGSPLTAPDSGNLTDLLIDPTNASVLYGVGEYSGGSSNCAEVHKSTNGGASWTTINPSTVPSTLCAGPLVMDTTTPSTLYLGVNKPMGGPQTAIVYKTTDGGATWTSVSTGLSFSLRRLAISRGTPAVLYGSSGSQVYKTTDSGGTWTTVNSSLPSGSNFSTGRLAIHPADPNIVYVATSGGVYGTTNGGTTWTLKSNGWPTIKSNLYGAAALAIDPLTPTTLYASAQSPGLGPVGFLGSRAVGTGLFKSIDSGATWTSASAVLSGVSVFDLAFDGTRAMYASTNNGLFILSSTIPTITVDRTALAFSAVTTGAAFASKTSSQAVRISQTGTGTVTWTATSASPWLVVSPTSGSGSATLTVSVQFAAGLSPAQSGAITLAFTGASNTAGPVTVVLNTLTDTAAAVPFGAFDTPADGITGVAGSIGVTGWALDDVEVTRVRVFRDPVAGEPVGALVFLGDAVFVDGARSDIQGVYPTMPRASRAGWGYLMLTNFLPGLGNGTFVLHAIAEDADGHSVTLGTKTITCSNSTATLPFGAIDTPGQGQVITSSSMNNFGWVLSPGSRKASPPDGGAVTVFINGVPTATPSGWTSRSDLAGLFPVADYSGIGNALGVATLDMTALANGVHTISWLVTDNLGGASGVGSRYFTVSRGSLMLDPSGGGASRGRSTVIGANTMTAAPSAALLSATSGADPIAGRRGFNTDAPLQAYSVTNGRATVQSEELDRIELQLEGVEGGRRLDGASYVGYLRVGDGFAPLPVGSTLNAETGEFTWQPGVAFVGAYDFVFARVSGGGAVTRRDVRVVLNAKGSNRVGPQTVIDVADGRIVAGWAADLDSQVDSGVDAIHVWAYPADGGDPVFVGAVNNGGARPDVAAIYGQRFLRSGYGLRVTGLAPGAYDLAVFAYSTVQRRFVPAKTARISVPSR
jgi:photosystem II stability/assembly factor-like uncharacterized protein